MYGRGRENETITVTDTRGNSYKKAIQFNETSDGNTVGIYYAENIGGGANTVKVTDTSSATLRFAILEYSGVATSGSLDVTATATGNGTAANSGSAVTTASGDLLLGTIMTSDPENYTAGSGYKIEASVPALPSAKLMVEDQIQGSSGTASASATLGASNIWAAGLAAFKAGVGTGGTSPSILSLESNLGTCRNVGDHHGDELRSDAEHKYGEVQRNGRYTNELECDKHCCTRTEWSDDGHRSGNGRRSGKQRSEL